MLTYEEQEAMREARRNEVGTEPPCPFCQRPRVKRSDYIRCNPCGVNWLDGEDITKNPNLERSAAMKATGYSKLAPKAGAQTAEPTSDPD